MSWLLPRHGGQLRGIAEHFGLDLSKLLDFSANINPEGPPLSAIAAVQAAAESTAAYTHYPDLQEIALRQALGEYAGVPADHVLVANGFVPLLDAALRSLRLRRCLLPVPAFNEYRRVLEQNNTLVVPVVLRSERGFRYPFESLLCAEGEAILLANPQNPTGALCERAELLNFVAEAQRRGKQVLLDEAFIDYLPAESLASAASTFSNLIVFRSVTKFFGMPGLRVAYAVAGKQLCTAIAAYLPPWPITTLASIAAATAVKDLSYITQTINQNSTRRSLLAAGLSRLHIDCGYGAANFLLLQIPDAAARWRQLLTEHDVVLRSCQNYEALPEGYLRAAVRDEHANAKLLQSLAQVLAT